jgi:hypothetical protein
VVGTAEVMTYLGAVRNGQRADRQSG